MLKYEEKYVIALKKILNDIDYKFLMKNIRGQSDFIDPWYDFEKMKKLMENLSLDNLDLLKLFYLGVAVEKEKIINYKYFTEILLLVESGLLLEENNLIKTNNLVVLLYQNLFIIAEINPWYETCSNKDTDIYIGYDSLRLGENINFDKNACVLDLCSGTGIQGMLAAKSAAKVISVEINEKAANVLIFNINLNGLQDIMEVRIGNLFSVLNNEKFDYIYVNPPFIPVPEDTNYPICGTGGSDGLVILNTIIDNINDYLNEDGKCVIFCQSLGDSNDVFFNEKIHHLSVKYNWDVKNILLNRLFIKYHEKLITEFTGLVNESFDYDNFLTKLQDTHNELKAQYLYTLLYQISKSKSSKMKIINLCNKWDINNSAIIIDRMAVKKNEESYTININNQIIGYVDDEALAILNELKKGIKLKDIAESLYKKFEHKYKKYGMPSFESKILDTCVQLESIGAIKKK